jgi:hypothetical protein
VPYPALITDKKEVPVYIPKEEDFKMERTISFMNGEGSIGHNTRRFIAGNVDASRTPNNITLIHEDIKQAYHKLFDKALKEYNAKQKRKDRQIKSYYEKISRSKQEKLFYEVIVQIGNKDDTGVGSSAAEVATWVLKDYVKMFQHRNPQLYVIGAYIHLDEETPHLHLNFVPWVSGCKRGLETKTSLKAALATRGFASEGKGNTEWKQWAEAEKDDIALIMRRYGIDWKKKNTHNQHLSVLDYKKQERVKEVADLEEKLEGAQVVLQLKEERIESLEKEIEDKHVSIRKEQSEAQKMLNDTKAETRKLQLETTDLRIKNSELRLEYYDNLDQLADKQKEIEAVQKEADKWMMIMDTAKWQTEQAQMKLEEAERLKKELLGTVDGDDYLKEQVIELRYQNQMLQEENRSLKDKLEKAYEFMKQFVIGGMNLLERFWEWIGEKVRDVGRGR